MEGDGKALEWLALADEDPLRAFELGVLGPLHVIPAPEQPQLVLVEVGLWNPQTQRCEATLEGDSSHVNALAVLPDGKLASGSSDETIKLWNRRPEAMTAPWRVPDIWLTKRFYNR